MQKIKIRIYCIVVITQTLRENWRKNAFFVVPVAVFSWWVYQHRSHSVGDTHTLSNITIFEKQLVKPSQLCLFWMLSSSIQRPNNTNSIMSIWNPLWIWHTPSKQATLQHVNRNLTIKTQTGILSLRRTSEKSISTQSGTERRFYAAFLRLEQEKAPKRRGEKRMSSPSHRSTSSTRVK